MSKEPGSSRSHPLTQNGTLFAFWKVAWVAMTSSAPISRVTYSLIVHEYRAAQEAPDNPSFPRNNGSVIASETMLKGERQPGFTDYEQISFRKQRRRERLLLEMVRCDALLASTCRRSGFRMSPRSWSFDICWSSTSWGSRPLRL